MSDSEAVNDLERDTVPVEVAVAERTLVRVVVSDSVNVKVDVRDTVSVGDSVGKLDTDADIVCPVLVFVGLSVAENVLTVLVCVLMLVSVLVSVTDCDLVEVSDFVSVR